MAIKKSELYSSLWASCDELRGGMDASQYKDYVLVLLFIKYVSDKYAGQPYAPVAVPKGSSFQDLVALKGTPDIGDQINKKIIAPLANANKLGNMPDFNDPSKLGSGKERVQRLTNLNLPRYIDNRQAEDLQDLNAHLKGGVPAADIDALQEYWTVCPTLRIALFKKNRDGYLDLAVSKSDIKTAIHEHAEFRTFIDSMNAHFDVWRNRWAGEPGNAELQLGLTTLKPGFHPKELIAQLSEDLLKHYLGQPLMDAYGVYQILMDYWAETMQDDAYAVAVDGWQAKPTRIVEVDKKGKEKVKGWACDLIPKPLIVARYFAEEQSALDALNTELETVSARLAELEEEHGGEEGAFAELEKVNKGEVARRLKEISSLGTPSTSEALGTPSSSEALGTPSSSSALNETDNEPAILQEWLDTNSRESDLKKQIKEAEAELDAAAYAKYAELTEKEIKELVIEDKWLATLSASVHGEMDRISQTLTRRVKELAERYETPLPDLATRADALEEKVRGHLTKMGFQA